MLIRKVNELPKTRQFSFFIFFFKLFCAIFMTEKPQGKNNFHLHDAKHSEVEIKWGRLLHSQQMISIFLEVSKAQ